MKNIFHIHRYDKPIASRYRSFNGRDIIFECRCGKREMREVYRRFGDPFPIETNMLISYQDMNKILEGATPPEIGSGIMTYPVSR